MNHFSYVRFFLKRKKTEPCWASFTYLVLLICYSSFSLDWCALYLHSPSGLTPCTDCPRDTYWVDGPDKARCDPCPYSTNTNGRGGRALEDCLSMYIVKLWHKLSQYLIFKNSYLSLHFTRLLINHLFSISRSFLAGNSKLLSIKYKVLPLSIKYND